MRFKTFLIIVVFILPFYIVACSYTGTFGELKDSEHVFKKSNFDKAIDSQTKEESTNYAQKKGWHLPIADVDQVKCDDDLLHPHSSGLKCQNK